MSGYHAKSLMYVFSFERVSELIGSFSSVKMKIKKSMLFSVRGCKHVVECLSCDFVFH